MIGTVACGGDPADLLLRIGAVLVCYAGFSLLQRRLRGLPLLRSLSLPLNLLALGLLLLSFLSSSLGGMHRYVLNGLLTATAFFALTVILKACDAVLFDLAARWRRTAPVPLVIRDIGRWVLSLLALVLLVRHYFPDVNLNVLAVSSLVVGYIVGNATQDTLGNLIAGLALNAERPFHIGDWVTVSGHTGVVVDTTWRATRLRTKAEDFIVIPNSAIAREPIVNFSRPTRCHGCYASIGVSYETPPNKAREAIRAALSGVPEVLQEPAPSIYLTAYADFSINFTIKYFIDDYARLNAIESLVMDRLWYAFKRAGIGIPFPIRDVRVRDATREDARQAAAEDVAVRRLLEGVDLLRSLKPDELTRLAAEARSIPYAEGETLFRQGQPGDTFHVIRAGRVCVMVSGTDGRAVRVAELGPGGFFGEMSLLTGEPRSATIVAETDVVVLSIAKAVFAGLLRDEPDLAARLADILAQRQADSHTKLAVKPDAGGLPAAREAMLSRIRRFFGMA